MIFDPHSSNRLTGKHAILYRESLGTLLDLYRDCLLGQDSQWEWSFGITMFDELHWHSQMQLLLEVSQCVLQGTGNSDAWTALQKAAFYTVYRNVFQQLELERDVRSMNASAIERSLVDRDWDQECSVEFDDIDYGDEDDSNWKTLIELACEERCLEEGLTPEEIEQAMDHDPESDDLCHWETLLEGLADQFLADRDFELATTLLDADPVRAAVIKTHLGIDQDYFIETAPEADGQQLMALYRELMKLAESPGNLRPNDDPSSGEPPASDLGNQDP